MTLKCAAFKLAPNYRFNVSAFKAVDLQCSRCKILSRQFVNLGGEVACGLFATSRSEVVSRASDISVDASFVITCVCEHSLEGLADSYIYLPVGSDAIFA